MPLRCLKILTWKGMLLYKLKARHRKILTYDVLCASQSLQ